MPASEGSRCRVDVPASIRMGAAALPACRSLQIHRCSKARALRSVQRPRGRTKCAPKNIRSRWRRCEVASVHSIRQEKRRAPALAVRSDEAVLEPDCLLRLRRHPRRPGAARPMAKWIRRTVLSTSIGSPRSSGSTPNEACHVPIAGRDVLVEVAFRDVRIDAAQRLWNRR